MSIYEKLWALPENVKDVIQDLGDYLQYGLPILTLVLSLFFMPHHFLWVYVGYFAVSMAVMMLAKALFNNDRPREVEDSEDPDDNPDLDLDWSPDAGNSVYSGHTSAAVCGAYPAFYIDPWLGGVMIILACFVGFSRIVAKAHWIRDVVLAFVVNLILWVGVVYFFL